MKSIPVHRVDLTDGLLLKAFAPALVESLQPLAEWCTPQVLTRAAERHIEEVLRRVADATSNERAFQRFATVQHALEDFRPRLIMRGNTYVALAEIRFKGLDPVQPFVELSLLDHRDNHIAEVASAALDAFAPFKPQRARAWFDAEGVSKQHVSGLRLAPDQYCLVGHLQTLKQRAGQASRLHLKPATQGSGAYERYKSLHQQYATERPEMACELYLLSENEFADLLKHGMAYDAFSDSEWAGFVAAAPAPLWGQSGIAMQEEFLAAEFRGRGFGPWLQRALLERLEGPDDALFWGTIHADNLPSLRTARAVGRVPIGAACWFSVGA